MRSSKPRVRQLVEIAQNVVAAPNSVDPAPILMAYLAEPQSWTTADVDISFADATVIGEAPLETRQFAAARF
jgi:hypothetical protein